MFTRSVLMLACIIISVCCVLYNVMWMCSCELIVVHALFRGFPVLIEKHRAHELLYLFVC